MTGNVWMANGNLEECVKLYGFPTLLWHIKEILFSCIVSYPVQTCRRSS